VTPETRTLDAPVRLTPRRLWIGAAVCATAGVVVAVMGFSSATMSTPELQADPSVTDSTTGIELPTFSLPLEREFRPRLPRG
jgi:hypothetical protein